MVLQINILDEFIQRAEKYAKDSLSYTYDRFKLDNSERKNKIIVGKIGEECALKVFNDNQISCLPDETSHKEIDYFDFISKDKSIDIKTCSQAFHKRLLVVKDKFDTYKKHDYYIGIRINMARRIAIIYGYANMSDIQTADVENQGYKDNYSILLDDLRPIEELLEKLKD